MSDEAVVHLRKTLTKVQSKLKTLSTNIKKSKEYKWSTKTAKKLKKKIVSIVQKNKRALLILLIGLLVASIASTVASNNSLQEKIDKQEELIEAQEEQVETTEEIIKEKEEVIDEVKTDLERLEEEKDAKDAEIKQLEKDLQAKLKREEAARLARATPATTSTNVSNNAPTATSNVAPAPVVAVSYSGTKEQWMSAAGIPQSEWWAVDSIVTRESGWNPCAYNPGQSNCNLSAAQVNATKPAGINVACGLGQQLPCGKWDSYGHWSDPVAALRAQYAYVNARYGGYAGAVSFWNVNHWY